MRTTINRYLLLTYSLLLTTAGLLAQPESESPYSSSEAPDTEQTAFDGPILWIGLILVGGALLYVLVRGRHASR